MTGHFILIRCVRTGYHEISSRELKFCQIWKNLSNFRMTGCVEGSSLDCVVSCYAWEMTWFVKRSSWQTLGATIDKQRILSSKGNRGSSGFMHMQHGSAVKRKLDISFEPHSWPTSNICLAFPYPGLTQEAFHILQGRFECIWTAYSRGLAWMHLDFIFKGFGPY